MQKVTTILVFLLLFTFFLLGGCGLGRSITVRTGWGKETIPGHCFAWTDGCDIYCRIKGTDIEYTKDTLKENCKDRDIRKSQCVDNEPEKLKYCDKMQM